MSLHPKVRDALVSALGPFINLVAFRFRPLAVVFFVLPSSVVLRSYLSVRDSLWLLLNSSSYAHKRRALHNERVARVCDVVSARAALPEDERKPMCTSRAPWANLSMRFSDYKAKSHQIYVGDLRTVVYLDEAAGTLHVEPLAEVGAITRYLVPRGYMLATTLEIEEATIGGLAMAVGMTTASHKYGLLQETVVEYEIVLGDGRLVRARADNEYADLYFALPWSHGSLGLLVGLTLRVVPVKPHVLVRYTPHNSMSSYCEHIRTLAGCANVPHPIAPADIPDFVEATIFSLERGVVMEGRFVDASQVAGVGVNHIGYWFKPWFFKHVQSMLKRNAPHQELVPTLEYIFRHNRAIFWTLRDQLPAWIGNNPIFRLLFGWMMPPKVSFLKMPATKEIQDEMRNDRVYQDITMPISSLEAALVKCAVAFGVWPMLVYPSRIADHGPQRRGLFPTRVVGENPVIEGFTWPGNQELRHDVQYGMFYDLGVYGIPENVRRGIKVDNIARMRDMEDFTRRVGGAPFLYADTYMTPNEFEQMFDVELYDKVRKKYGAEGCFPHVYAKTTSVRPGMDMPHHKEPRAGDQVYVLSADQQETAGHLIGKVVDDHADGSVNVETPEAGLLKNVSVDRVIVLA